MRRPALLLAAFAGLAAAAAPAAAQRDVHQHQNVLFELEVEPELNDTRFYRAFFAVPGDPASLTVERVRDSYSNPGTIDLSIAQCPALRPAIEAIGRLTPLPISLADERNWDPRIPRPTHYTFRGHVRFPNGGEGEIRFTAADGPGRGDPPMERVRALQRAFDACRAWDGRYGTPGR